MSSFHAGSITGDVTLDIAPLKASVAAAKAQVVSLQASTAGGLNLKFNDSFAARGNSIFESVRTPMERHGQLQRELNVLLHAGAINETTYARAISRSAGEAKSMNAVNGARLAQMARLGGGLALVGLAMRTAVTGMNAGTEAMKGYHDGTLSGAQAVGVFTEKLGRSVWGLGDFADALIGLKNEWDGTADLLRQFDEQQAYHIALVKRREDAYNAMANAIKDADSQISDIGRKMTLDQASSPGQKIRFHAEFDFADAMAQIESMQHLLDQMTSTPEISKTTVGGKEIADLTQRIAAYQHIATGMLAGGLDAGRLADFKPISDLQKQVRQFDMTPLQIRFEELKETLAGKPTLLEDAKKALDELRGKQVGGIFDDLQSQLAAIDMTPLEAKFDEFRRANKILDPAELAKAKQMMEEIDVKSKVKDALESIRSPMDKYKETLDQLREWRDAGRITAEQFGKLNAKARKDAFGDAKLPGLIRAGSAEAQALSYDRERGVRSGQESLPQLQIAQLKISNQRLDLIAHYLQQQLQRNGGIEIVGY